MVELILPRVKVCGLASEADLRVALEAGAEAVGFVRHAPSPRSLGLDAMARLVALVPDDVLSVLVLVDAPPDATLELAVATGAGAVQLCGSERAAEWRGFPRPILRRIAVEPGADEELERWAGIARAFVLDHPASPGGSGRSVDLALAAQLAKRAPCLLAGGLDAGNVRARFAAVRPAGVDASSRLERAPGVKEPERVRAFVRAALDCFAEART